MFWTKMSLFMIKFTRDKSNVTTPLIIACFSTRVNLEKILNILKHQTSNN